MKDKKVYSDGRANSPRDAYMLRVSMAKELEIDLPEGDLFLDKKNSDRSETLHLPAVQLPMDFNSSPNAYFLSEPRVPQPGVEWEERAQDTRG